MQVSQVDVDDEEDEDMEDTLHGDFVGHKILLLEECYGDSGKSKGDKSCSPNISGKMSTVGVL
ncbi:hypothetical protein DPMN_001722 [Dreissena polymorpha]|uniref:Uncharacterized protein n=1 Tax=Dreissena polymorpha TaxID=45954 RepID=A0A9D4RT63_DREPO|nr:hypothetical protein DPMN_001722 [Dreissena polymorpha]